MISRVKRYIGSRSLFAFLILLVAGWIAWAIAVVRVS